MCSSTSVSGQFQAEHKLDIVEAFRNKPAPLGLPGKLKSLDEVKEGSTVSAPNDPSNFARALVMLNELKQINRTSTRSPAKNDIAENLKNIKIIELEAAQLPRSAPRCGLCRGKR